MATACLLALAVALFVLPATTYTAKVPHDILGYFDVMHRLSMGQQPHVDYHTPVGWLAYGLPWLGHLALGQFGGALEFGSAIVLAVLLPLAAVALHGRAPIGPGLLLLFALLVLFGRMLLRQYLDLRLGLFYPTMARHAKRGTDPHVAQIRPVQRLGLFSSAPARQGQPCHGLRG